MAPPQPKTGLFVGLNKGHIVTRRELPPRPSSRKGVDPLTHQVKLCDFGSAKVLILGIGAAMDAPESDPWSVKENVPLFNCDLFDKAVARKISQLLLFGLATACVDNTTGLFKGPASVAVVIRKEMVDYLKQRSQAYIAEATIQGGANATSVDEFLEGPTEVVSVLIDEFVGTKRNLFSRVLGWLSSKGQEEKIDDFVQEMETNAFWPMDRREVVAAILIRNVDLRNVFDCSMKFDSAEQLAEHKNHCGYRTLNCMNNGCKAKFSAMHAEKHDLECPFKIIPCEQMCSEMIMRREMDKHCVTVCAMKLVNCPFFQVGCESAFPQYNLEKHCSEFLQSHLLYVLGVIHKQKASMEELRMRVQLLEKSHLPYVLGVIHKQEASMEELRMRVQLLEKAHSINELSEALGVRSLTLVIKEQEAKMNKLERNVSKIQNQQELIKNTK